MRSERIDIICNVWWVGSGIAHCVVPLCFDRFVLQRENCSRTYMNVKVCVVDVGTMMIQFIDNV